MTLRYHINGKTRLLFVDILEAVFKERSDKWVKCGKNEKPHYSDLEIGRIRNKFAAANRLVQKDFLAVKMAKSGHIPKTYVIPGSIPPQSKEDKEAKWFLKPAAGWGGTGINIFKGRDNYKKFIAGTETRRKYVLQKEVANPMLFEGRKFDIRTFVAVIFTEKQYHFYLYPEAICRTSLAQYSENTAAAAANITNTHLQEKMPGYSSEAINKLFTQHFPWNVDVWPTFTHMVMCVFNKMKDAFGKTEQPVVEIMSFDYIVDTSMNVFLIEINRNIGYGFSRKAEDVKNVFLEMFRDLVDFAYTPLASDGKSLGEPAKWQKCGSF